jgi:hypothetical protein
MTNISRVDQAVLQLRAQLQRLARDKAQRSGGSAPVASTPLDRLREAHASEPAADEEFRRKFVRALLTEELGEALGNQAEFERIANEVWRVLDEDSGTRAMMDRAIRQLGGTAS